MWTSARAAHSGRRRICPVRGSTFSQVLVLVDGVRMNNSQTGHHNADLPFGLDQVDRIEVLAGAGSSLHGADAFGGTINIVTRTTARPTSASAVVGENGLVGGTFGATLGSGAVTQSINAQVSRSSGFMFDRDFRTAMASGRTAMGKRTAVDVAFSDREFGANGFYGNSPSKEWTQQVAVRPGLHARGA